MAARERLRAMEVSESTAVLRADRVYRFYRAGDEETLALQGVSFDLNPGEMVAVVGPSGSGKSTLLSCLTGLDEPSGGTVWVAGARMSHRPETIRARLRADFIGLMSQDVNLFNHLSLMDNVRLAQRLSSRGLSDAGEILDNLQLTHIKDAYPSEMSGGESARAGLAVALANDPPVLVADEPTGELDAVTEGVVLRLLRQRAETGKAVLIASHSSAVRRASDRVLTLEDGSLSE